MGLGLPMVTMLVGEYTAMPMPCVGCMPMKARNSPIPAEVASMMALRAASSQNIRVLQLKFTAMGNRS